MAAEKDESGRTGKIEEKRRLETDDGKTALGKEKKLELIEEGEDGAKVTLAAEEEETEEEDTEEAEEARRLETEDVKTSGGTEETRERVELTEETEEAWAAAQDSGTI